ncbi:MAG: VPLPA-CTERM sorting domain-containing protein [Boseongicola sp.]
MHFRKMMCVVWMLSFASLNSAVAANLDFNEVSPEVQASPTISLSNAEVTSLVGDSFVYGGLDFDVGPNGGFCALTTSFTCAGDAEVTFSLGPVSNLTFQTYFAGHHDSTIISIFDGLTKLASIAVNSNILVDFSAFSGITSVFIDDNSGNSDGIAYADWEFTQGVPNKIPLPASLPFLIAGLGCVSLLRRRTQP